MEKQAKQKVVVIGCGHVAWHIAKHLASLKRFSLFVYNHEKNPLLTEFKTRLRCHTAVGLDKVIPDASVYVICVTDKYISELSGRLIIRNPNALLLHTSGSVPLQEISGRLCHTGVFYPLQTFSRQAETDWSVIPIITESSGEDAARLLVSWARLFSKTVIALAYQDRLRLHLAAVMVNNFTNALYVAASDLVHQAGGGKTLDFELLYPLIGQTTAKLQQMDPRSAQTGPARRRDKGVMKKHLALLSGQEELRKVYKQLSKLIVKQQEK